MTMTVTTMPVTLNKVNVLLEIELSDDDEKDECSNNHFADDTECNDENFWAII